MKLAHLVRFSALAEELHFPRAAASLGIPLASLYTTIDKLEEEVGQQLVTRTPPTRLTPAGELLLEEAHARIADAPPQAAAAAPKPRGGKAKASKGTGRAPIVKGQPKPYKKRQGR
ncbi:LysR family transcriptional regulator [Microbacterium enclense]|uniref:LysR family transcriptional regulator n=1 Tax=Microbacterium enclense TaxID=993073 RepID=UPI0036DF9BA8